MKISDRLKSRRKLLGLTQEQLAQASGVSQNAIHKIEDGTIKKPRSLLEIADALSCDPEWLRSGGSDPAPIEHVPTVQYLPLIKWSQISDRLGGARFTSAQHYPSHVECSIRSFALIAQGIGMEPKFYARDILYVDPDAKYDHESYIIAENNGSYVLRQLIIEGNDLALRTTNSEIRNNLLSIKKDQIVGVVILSLKMLV